MITRSVRVIVADAGPPPPAVLDAIARNGATARVTTLGDALRDSPADDLSDAVVIVSQRHTPAGGDRLRALLGRIAEAPRGTLVICGADTPGAAVAAPPALPLSVTRAADADELTIRLQTLMDLRRPLECMHRGMLAGVARGEDATRRYVQQLRLARQIQREFLPATLPRYDRVSFATVFRPADFVSGDVYDIHPLDAEHVGIAIADATGHGIPAALLTVFIRRALRGKEFEQGAARLLAPEQVLARLNAELVEVDLAECRFLAVIYAVLNTRTLVLRFARGGAPFPLLRRADGSVTALRTDGGVVGVIPQAQFEAGEVQLARGDALLLHTDGLEKAIVPPEAWRTRAGCAATARGAAGTGARPAEAPTLDPPAARATTGTTALPTRPAARRDRLWERLFLSRTPRTRAGGGDSVILASAWGRILARDGRAAAFDQLALRHETLRRMGYPLDDLTVLSIDALT